MVAATPETCRGCGAGLSLEAGPCDPADERVQVVELPPIRAEVTEYRLAARQCRSCGTITRAGRPAEAGGGAFGPRLHAVATLLVGQYRLSRREAVACLAELGEVELSVGALARLEQATSMALEPVVEEVATAVRQVAVANLDETGWWQGKTRAWLWTMVTETLTLFRLDPHRSKAAAQALLGPDWTGIVGSDRYSAYRYLPLAQRQLCWAHLIREFRKIAAYNQHQRPLGERRLAITTRIFAAWYRFRDGAIDRPTLLLELAPLQTELRDALDAGLDPPHAVVAGALRGNLLDSWPDLRPRRRRRADQQCRRARPPPGRSLAQGQLRHPERRRLPFRRAHHDRRRHLQAAGPQPPRLPRRSGHRRPARPASALASPSPGNLTSPTPRRLPLLPSCWSRPALNAYGAACLRTERRYPAFGPTRRARAGSGAQPE